jgi:tetratricopeptide (TPR) repeat protein
MMGEWVRNLFENGKRPILWLGAGASCQAQPPLPTLGQVVEALRDQETLWRPPATLENPYALLDHFATEFANEGELQDFLAEKLRPGGKSPRPGPLHLHLAALIAAGCFEAVIDTNYDMLLRQACDEIGAVIEFSLLDRNLHLDDHDHPRYIALHGTWDDWNSVVLTGRSYADFEARHALAVHELALALRRHPVLFVGCSLQDPRVLGWIAALSDEHRRQLKRWVAVLGPGGSEALSHARWTDGRSQLEVLQSVKIKIDQLDSFADLPLLFEEIAVKHASLRNPELTVTIRAKEEWEVDALGETVRGEPPKLPEDIEVLRSLACHSLACDRDGRLASDSEAMKRALEARAVRAGQTLAAMLPPKARSRLLTLVGGAAGGGAATLRLRAEGEREEVDAAMLLPWELISVDGLLPVGDGRLHLVREVVVPGGSSLPADVSRPRIVAHVAMPGGAGVPDLALEAASFRIARALEPLDRFARFTDWGTLDDLTRVVTDLGSAPTILHFSGHGRPGELLFENEDGDPIWVSIDLLCRRLNAATPGRLPAAIWLSCCHGAGVGGAGHGASVAAELHRRGVAQVLGYFGPIADPLATRLDQQLFETLVAQGRTVEAVRVARLVSRDPVETDFGWALFPLAWATLALYHRGEDRRLISGEIERSETLEDRLAPRAIQFEGTDLQILEHGYIGRRRLFAALRWRRRRQYQRAIGLYGLGGLGKTAAMMRFSMLLVGAEKVRQDVVAIPAADYKPESTNATGFAWLLARINDVVATHARRPHDWDQRLAKIDESRDRPAALARALLEVASGGVLYLDNLETLQDPARSSDAGAPWCDDSLACFFAVLTSEVDASTTVLMTSRYCPTGSCGKWQELDTCSKAEIFRMTSWLDPFGRLPGVIREQLTSRIHGHPRSVEWLNILLREQENQTDVCVARDTDPRKLWDHVIHPAVAGFGSQIDQDLLLGKLLGHLRDDELKLLGECTAIGRPVPKAVIGELGTGQARLTSLGLLTRFGEDGWGLHPLVVHAVVARRKAQPWTSAGRSKLGAHCERAGIERGDLGMLHEALGHRIAACEWQAAIQLTMRLADAMRRAGWARRLHEFLEGLANVEWPDQERGRWSDLAGDAAGAVGAYPLAETRARTSIELLEHVHGTRAHPDVAVSLTGLANILMYQGNYKEAERTYLESIGVMEKAWGTRERLPIAVALHGLANVLAPQGKTEEAERTYLESIQVTEKVYGTRDRSEVATSLHGLANVLESQGKYEEAERTYEEAIRILEKVHGRREHHEVAAPLHGLANVLYLQRKHKKAAGMYVECISIQEKAYGTGEHPEIAAARAGLANVLSRLGEYEEAERMFMESIRVQEKTFGTMEHPQVAATLAGLGGVLSHRSKYEDAERTYRMVIAIETKVFGSRTTAATLPTLRVLAELLFFRLGRIEEAWQLASEAWEAAMQQRLLLEFVQCGPIYIMCALACQRTDDAHEAVPILLSALSQLPQGHPMRTRVEAKLASISGPAPA